MKNFIEVTQVLSGTRTKITINIKYIVEFGPIDGNPHKAYMITENSKMLWIEENENLIKEKIITAQR